MARRGEFDFIRTRLLPLTEGRPDALGLSDDAAVMELDSGRALVIASDMLVAGVHFLEDDPPETVAARCLRANLSDLAAMGAEPDAYLSSIAWPESLPDEWRDRFIAALEHEQVAFGIALIGGDTTSTPGPLTVSLTLLGKCPANAVLTRGGASPGEDVWVSGTIGDAGLGLEMARGRLEPDPGLLGRYTHPEPRISLGMALRGIASAALDVSDGLIADAGHLAETSDVSVVLDLDRMPVSDRMARWLGRRGAENELLRLASSGDDYEILFSAPVEKRPSVQAAAEVIGVPVTRIGTVEAGPGVVVTRLHDKRIDVKRGGFTHF